jgi:hypothetical protein
MTSPGNLFDREAPLRQLLDHCAAFSELPKLADVAELTTDAIQQQAVMEACEEVAEFAKSGNRGLARRWSAERAAGFAEQHGPLQAPEQPDTRSTDEVVDQIRAAGNAGFRPGRAR